MDHLDAFAGIRQSHKTVSRFESTLGVPPPATDAPTRVDQTGVELKRGDFLNTIAMWASNFRGVFTFLVARLLGPAFFFLISVAPPNTYTFPKPGVLRI